MIDRVHKEATSTFELLSKTCDKEEEGCLLRVSNVLNSPRQILKAKNYYYYLLRVENTPWCSASPRSPKQKLFVRKIPSQLFSQPGRRRWKLGVATHFMWSLPFFLLQSCSRKNFCLALEGSSWTSVSRWRTFDSLPIKCSFWLLWL